MKDRDTALRLAEAVRVECLRAAMRAYEEASISGLCHEGAWECAVGAIRSLDVAALLGEQKAGRRLEEGEEGLPGA